MTLHPKSLPVLLLACALALGQAQRVGEVDTVVKLIGPDHKIVVEAYDDPGVRGVTCYVSRADTGGIQVDLGLAENKAEASIACRQTGAISFPKPIPLQDEMYSEPISLVCLTYSDHVIEGSSQNSVTAVPVDRAVVIPVQR